MAPTPPAAASSPLIDDHDALPPGTRLSEFEIVRVLGIGGFGIVYLAQDHALERQVALKEYMPGSLAGRGKGNMVSLRSGAHTETYALGLRSFVNEARLLARFNHPSLVKVYRFWEENGTAYMVMPYLQGRTLRDVRRSISAPPTEAWIRGVVMPLLDGLELLHREGVFHRDIAPDNIVLPTGEPPVLLDFGAARRAIGDRTQTFTAILKPSYAPIEQYAEVVQLRQGPWTDLYALGAVVYYLLRGMPPPPATARAVQDDMALLLPPDDYPGFSPEFLAAIEWALAVRPSDRPQGAAALREVLEGRAKVPAPSHSGTTRTVLMPPSMRPSPFDDDAPDPVTVEPTQPLTEPPRPRTAPPRQRTTLPPHEPTTAMPASPTRAARRPALGWKVGAAFGIVGLLAAFAWVVGGRPAPAPVEAATPAVVVAPPAMVASPVAPALVASAPVLAEAASAAPRPRLRERLRADGASTPARAERPAAEAASPREACGTRVFLALAVCMEEQCERPRFQEHPQCQRVREMMERRRSRENGA